MATLLKPFVGVHIHSGCFHLHDVRVDHLVPVQRVVWHGHAIARALRQAVPRGRLHLHATY